ncbi:type II toxin-antitoxin system PemK/MazF family toxin [Lachnoanaerobaculum sp.]|uniref:type II toxin-antitoxin system PemK/MazF family toxin n=1 Tax=Lachnoanaerobaculum sp. TaxID=2049030 RepID=UPI002ED6A2A8
MTIVPLTTKFDKKVKQPTHFQLLKAKGLRWSSLVLGKQMGTYDKSCILRYLGKVSRGQMRGIDRAVKNQLGYYLDESWTQHYKKRPGE